MLTDKLLRRDDKVRGGRLFAGACLFLLLDFLLAPRLGPARFYFNLAVGVSGACVGVVSYVRARLSK